MIALIGLEFFCHELVKSLAKKNIEAEFIPETDLGITPLRKKLKAHSIVHFIWSPTISKNGVKTLIYCKFLNKRILVDWVGSDVLILFRKPFWRFVTKLLQPLIDVNTATAPNLVKELKQMGIQAEYQPRAVYSLFQVQPLPRENKIAVYLPDKTERDWKFYQGDLIKKIVNEFPKIDFIITGNSGKRFNEKNVTCIRWTDNIEEIYRQVKAVIRLPLHDGTSGIIISTLSMGRTMIASNTELPYCKIANNFEDLKKHVSETIENSQLNAEASKYVHHHFNNTKLTEEIITRYKKLN